LSKKLSATNENTSSAVLSISILASPAICVDESNGSLICISLTPWSMHQKLSLPRQKLMQKKIQKKLDQQA
jgi:hypothetical protein